MDQANKGNRGTEEQGNRRTEEQGKQENQGEQGRRGTGRTRRTFLKVANTNRLRFCPWSPVEC